MSSSPSTFNFILTKVVAVGIVHPLRCCRCYVVVVVAEVRLVVVELENVGKLMVAQVVDLKALECYNCFQGLGFDSKAAVLASVVDFEKSYG